MIETLMKDAFSSFPQMDFPKFEKQLGTVLPELSKLEAQVGQYMLLNIGDLSFETGASLAGKVGVSEITVSRLLRRLGYEGMRGLKRELRNELLNSQSVESKTTAGSEVPKSIADILDQEIDALREVFQQCTSPKWPKLVRTVADADRVYVTGFQTVRGIAEDCTRRLSLVRNDVRFLTSHDGMLTEWLGPSHNDKNHRKECLILIDVVPYANEAPILAKLCNDTNRSLVIVTDEMCHWAKNHTDLVIHSNTRSGLFLESTVAITAALNLIIHAVAEEDTAVLSTRLDSWKATARSLNIF